MWCWAESLDFLFLLSERRLFSSPTTVVPAESMCGAWFSPHRVPAVCFFLLGWWSAGGQKGNTGMSVPCWMHQGSFPLALAAVMTGWSVEGVYISNLHLEEQGSVNQHSAFHSRVVLMGINEEPELLPLRSAVIRQCFSYPTRGDVSERAQGMTSTPVLRVCSRGKWYSSFSLPESGSRILEGRKKGILQMKF